MEIQIDILVGCKNKNTKNNERLPSVTVVPLSRLLCVFGMGAYVFVS